MADAIDTPSLSDSHPEQCEHPAVAPERDEDAPFALFEVGELRGVLRSLHEHSLAGLLGQGHQGVVVHGSGAWAQQPQPCPGSGDADVTRAPQLQQGVILKNGPESTLRGTGPEHRSVIGRDGGPGLA